MRKILGFVIIFIFFMSVVPTRELSVLAKQTEETTDSLEEVVHTSGKYKYVVRGEKSIITDYFGKQSSVVVPSKLGGYPVVEIGDYAFLQCTSITSLKIPKTVKKIGELAFGNLFNLKKLRIPNGVTTIGDRAFGNCEKIVSVTIPKSVKNIGDGIFFGCDNLQTISVAPKNNKFCTKDGVLFNKDKTKLIQCPSRKKGTYVIPKSVKEIGASAFEQCYYLEKIVMPNSVRTIGETAFWNCINVRSITLSEKITVIPEEAFGYCKKLTKITIPKNVNVIGASAFEGCEKLKSIRIPKGVAKLEFKCFAFCVGLRKVVLPRSLKEIDASAFAYIEYKIKKVYYRGTKVDWEKVVNYSRLDTSIGKWYFKHN